MPGLAASGVARHIHALADWPATKTAGLLRAGGFLVMWVWLLT